MNVTPATHYIVYVAKDFGIDGHPVAGFETQEEADDFAAEREQSAADFGFSYRVEPPVGKTTIEEAYAIEAAAYDTTF